MLVLSTNVHAFESKLGIFEQFDNFRLVAFISKKDITNSPEWNPDLGTPPLTVGEAIQAVKDFNKASKIFTNIKEIEIRPVPKREKHWHYLVKIANDEMKAKFNIYVVLMNGKVIPAIIEPQGYK